jgi:hypothetical protein
VHAPTLSHIYSSFAKIAEALRKDSDGFEPKNLYVKVMTCLQDPMSRPWLMIVDNADDRDVLFHSELGFDIDLERCPHGAFLFTTKHKNMGDQLTKWTHSRITDGNTEAVALIKSILGNEMTQSVTESLASKMEYLPLALTQAAAYVRLKSIAIEHYLDMWRASRDNAQELLTSDLFEAPGRRAVNTKISNSVAQTMTLTLDTISRNNKRAEKILSIMAFSESNNVPTKLIIEDKE